MSCGVNFTNVLRTAFMRADPKSVKKTDNLIVFSVLSGSSGTKAARRTLMNLTLGFEVQSNGNGETWKTDLSLCFERRHR